jgi:hypothetical protein
VGESDADYAATLADWELTVYREKLEDVLGQADDLLPSPAHPAGSRPGHQALQGAKGYTQLRKRDVDVRFPGLLDSILSADSAAQV